MWRVPAGRSRNVNGEVIFPTYGEVNFPSLSLLSLIKWAYPQCSLPRERQKLFSSACRSCL
jgi:hypothetical protein